MRVSVVCVIDDGEEMLCDDNSKLKRNARFSCLCYRRWWRNVLCDDNFKLKRMRVSVVCVIDDGEEMLCDDNSKLKRNVRFSCLCNRRWWRNVVWW